MTKTTRMILNIPNDMNNRIEDLKDKYSVAKTSIVKLCIKKALDEGLRIY